MKMFFSPILTLISVLLLVVACGPRVISVPQGGNATKVIAGLLEGVSGNVVLEFDSAGVYNFHPSELTQREYYISNHDQTNPKQVGIALENLEGVELRGNGAEFLFHGRMIPLSVVGCTDVVVSGVAIDFSQPQIGQITILSNDTRRGEITYELAPWMDFRFDGNRLVNQGPGWVNTLTSAIAFDGNTRHILYRTADVRYTAGEPLEVDNRRVRVRWDNPQLVPGTVLALRSWHRPTPGIFVADSRDVVLRNTTVHYAEGMGLLAQMSENITLDGFNVRLRGNDDPRYFTTQADATHFSGCKGLIHSTGGVYEGMMDDAINVHGTYLKIVEKLDDRRVVGQYMHSQAWGFRWGESGDSVQFVVPQTMELTSGGVNFVSKITPHDKESVHGAKQFLVEFEQTLDSSVVVGCGIENLSWTPEVVFSENVVRNNRARGALFSTPRKTVVQNNLFDHTSGTAILLCGDCNGWFETGACRDVLISGNTFINALTSMYQFTNAVISIYPEIPNLEGQRKFFHGGEAESIVIEDNVFETFDAPLVYAKSVDGLVFRNNKVVRSDDFEPFHWISVPFYFERVGRYEIAGNEVEGGFDQQRDVKSL